MVSSAYKSCVNCVRVCVCVCVCVSERGEGGVANVKKCSITWLSHSKAAVKSILGKTYVNQTVTAGSVCIVIREKYQYIQSVLYPMSFFVYLAIGLVIEIGSQ